ncbi:MAG: ABC transporter ATP-binding protein, partial [Micrococcales bacterium]|nr:ABC transporter ATP-binding protein [Micrococcales bacterium]
GIGMVFQHFMLADNLTVLENVVLGAEKLHGIGSAARAEIRRISDDYHLDIDPDDLVADLGVGARQRVEILKVLYRGAKTLILDEPTAVLVPQEVDELFDNLRELKAEGLTVLFISHKLDEVLSVADSITVIRRGTTVDTVDPTTVNARQLAELMVGSELPTPATEESTVTDKVLLRMDGITLAGGEGRDRLHDVSLTIHAGEVVGIAGVEGNGQAELVEVIMGMREPTSGLVFLEDTDISDWEVREIREAGVGYIPEDRHRHGLLLEAPLWENRMLGHQTQEPNIAGGGHLVDAKAAKADTERIVKEYDVRTPSIHVTAGSLSGGNQQKLIVGREMSHNPRVLVASHPTRGVDVGAQAAIWDHIRRARREGLGVLLISADLEELIGLSDTIHVILRGRLTGEFDPDTVTSEQLGAAMTGAGGDAPADASASPAAAAPGATAARPDPTLDGETR